MPPRAARAAKRATRPPKQTRPPARGNAKKTRTANRVAAKRSRTKIAVLVDEEEEEKHEDKPKKEEWLFHLPPVIKPDEELHKKLTYERKQQRAQKISGYCREELNAIFNYAFEAFPYIKELGFDDFIKSRYQRRMHAGFRNGEYYDKPIVEVEKPKELKRNTIVKPLYSLDPSHYLKVLSNDKNKDLSVFFKCTINENVIHDANPIFDSNLQYLQSKMQSYIAPFKLYEKQSFPFIVSVIGPPNSGKTTVCQFLRKLFKFTIIDVKPLADTAVRKKKGASPEPEPEIPEYPLEDTIPIKVPDDKTIVATISQIVKDSQNHNGFVIIGYPNTKTQHQTLEKAISVAINTNSSISRSSSKNNLADSERPSSRSGSTKTPPTVYIHGIIITTSQTPNRTKLIDPETSNVYTEGFHMPSFIDFIGNVPTEFIAKQREISDRLISVTYPEIPPVPQKVFSSYNTFDSYAKKLLPTCQIPKCQSSTQVMEILDKFINRLIKNSPILLPQNPLSTINRPIELIKPSLCYHAVQTWRSCVDMFGNLIAEQSNLVSALANKLDDLIEASLNRFALLVSTADNRITLCESFKQNPTSLPQFFNQIWELTLKSKSEGLNIINDVILKSGLIELIIELRKAPKLVFISIMHKFYYVKWFRKTYKDLFDDENIPFNHFLDDLVVDTPTIPKVNMVSRISLSISSYKSDPNLLEPLVIAPVRANSSLYNFKVPQSVKNKRAETSFTRPSMPDHPGFKTLISMFPELKEKGDDLVFDSFSICQSLDVYPVEVSSSFDDIDEFSEEFMQQLGHVLDDQCLVKETETSLEVFKHFAAMVKKKESTLVSAILDLKEKMNNMCYLKCSREMEHFSTNFRKLKRNETFDDNLFEYSLGIVNPKISHLTEFSIRHNAPLIAQELVTFESIERVCRRVKEMNIEFTTHVSFMEIVDDCDLDESDRTALEYCMRVMVCVECFNCVDFLMNFAQTNKQALTLMGIFNIKGENSIVNNV